MFNKKINKMNTQIEIQAADNFSGYCLVYFEKNGKKECQKMTEEEAQVLLNTKQKTQLFNGCYNFTIGEYDFELLSSGKWIEYCNKHKN